MSVKPNGLCFKCLQPQHNTSECDKESCSVCSGQHNVLLHYDKSKRNKSVNDTKANIVKLTPESTSVQTAELQQIVTSHFGDNATESQILLSTA